MKGKNSNPSPRENAILKHGKKIPLIPQMGNASNKAIVFPRFGGIAFHHFHQESDENRKIQ
jgi:hypothetical protein